MIDPREVSEYLGKAFPDAKCSLNFRSPFECLVAVSLSAQTTDEAVNRVTPALFEAYPTPKLMGEAEFFLLVHGRAGRLFAVAQGGIKEIDAIVHGGCSS